MFMLSPRDKKKRFNRARWNAELAVRAHRFVNHGHALFECKNIQWTQCNACTAAKTSVIVHDERFVWTPSHVFVDNKGYFGVFAVKRKHSIQSGLENQTRDGTP